MEAGLGVDHGHRYPRRPMSRWSVVIALFVIGCAGGPATPAPRRPLVTDELPLGLDDEDVLAWYLDHGWCPVALAANRVVFRTCGSGQPVIVSELRFEHGRLAVAEVRTRAGDDLDALTAEVEARHGRPRLDAQRRRTWVVGDETIAVFREDGAVVERHTLARCYGYC